MKLHLDQAAFTVLLDSIHAKTGYRTDVLEKDYYVTLMLEELAEKQKDGLKAYFKGGTALYKALKTTNRFSEDIDLSVDTRGCSRTQNDKRLEQATKKYSVLPRVPEEGRTNRSEVIAVYHYEPVTSYDHEDALQRFGRLKIEATSFTISEPVMDLQVSAMLYDLADNSQRQILEAGYEVKPFQIQTMTLERIFIDKIFAAEAYTRKSDDPHRAFEAAKHIYDLSVIADHSDIERLYQDEIQMGYLLDIRMTEEKDRLDGVPGVLPKEFIIFSSVQKNEKIRQAYEIMQRQYVMRAADRISYDSAAISIKNIQSRLEQNTAWQCYGMKN
ncbi:MAG: nucleotidyl transferase AbiEii/AbiGii toxin family protein [Lachnospiraceae bacterium]|nr:nucleotidyl transferase AbiEii/AbiGii toxin family protein [Lachnospiraceae bacterium]